MKYNELQLDRLTPDGLPLNDSAAIVSRGAINIFFLRAFEAFYSSFQDEAIATQAPYSLEACLACSDDELNGFLTDAGASVFSPCEHEIKARFANALAVSSLCSDALLDELVKFAFGRRSVSGCAVYDGCAPYHFKIRISGDVTNSDISRVVGERINSNVNLFNTCTEKLDAIEIEQIERKTDAIFTGGAAVGGCFTAEPLKVQTPTFYDFGAGLEIPVYEQSRGMFVLGDIFFVSTLRKTTDERFAFAYEMTPSEGYSGRGSYFLCNNGETFEEVQSRFGCAELEAVPNTKIKKVLLREPNKEIREVEFFAMTAEGREGEEGVRQSFGRLVFAFAEEVAENSAICIFGTQNVKTELVRSRQSKTYIRYYGQHYNAKKPYVADHELYNESLGSVGTRKTFLNCRDFEKDSISSMIPFGLKFFFEY